MTLKVFSVGNENVTTFHDEVIGLYATDKLPCPINITDPTGKLYYYLKIISSTTFFAKMVQVYTTITPYSCGPERAVSCHTILKSNKQSCYSRDAINSRMYIALNRALEQQISILDQQWLSF